MLDEDAYHGSEISHSWGFLAGLLVGLAGGTVAAVLFAPATGRDARSYVANRARSSRDRAASMVERGIQTMSDGRQVLHEGREILSSALRDGREAYDHVKASEA